MMFLWKNSDFFRSILGYRLISGYFLLLLRGLRAFSFWFLCLFPSGQACPFRGFVCSPFGTCVSLPGARTYPYPWDQRTVSCPSSRRLHLPFPAFVFLLSTFAPTPSAFVCSLPTFAPSLLRLYFPSRRSHPLRKKITKTVGFRIFFVSLLTELLNNFVKFRCNARTCP